MIRQPVSSSNLRSVGYDTSTWTLEIEFRKGRVYQYYDVPEDIYNQLVTASSKGTFHHHYIKNRYRYLKML